MNNYPDISVLYEQKEEWRIRMLQRPIEEKIETANRLRRLAQEIPKLKRHRQAAEAKTASDVNLLAATNK